MNDNLRTIALKTIELQAASIAGLAAFIDADFEKVIHLILLCKGRVVVSGVGKSAIVAQKIVATLNSTGTPAIFMHAADAIHGDLGMIQADDIVIILSKSGESPEIKVLIPLIKNFGNVLIGMGGNISSYLFSVSDYFLNTTVSQEACPNNLAPTTSTTAQMVMGDALAICLMEMRGFTGHDFARVHPGGNLGKRLYLRVEDLYHFNAKPQVAETAGLKDIILEMTKSRMGATAVVNDRGQISGIITDGDLRRMLESADNVALVSAAHIFHAHPKTILPDQLAVTALDILRSNDISQLIVIDESNHYLGMLHLHDLVREGIV